MSHVWGALTRARARHKMIALLGERSRLAEPQVGDRRLTAALAGDHDLAERYLHLAAECALDIANHRAPRGRSRVVSDEPGAMIYLGADRRHAWPSNVIVLAPTSSGTPDSRQRVAVSSPRTSA